MSNSATNTTVKGSADHNLYGYDPSKTTALTFVALFSLSGLAHFILMFPYRTAFFIPLIFGSAAEAGGYYFRSLSASDTHRILPFVMNGLLILAAAPLLAATIYMMFGRIVRNLKGESSSMISPKWLTALFVLVDLVCLGTQLTGSALRADVSSADTGSHLLLGGLILQVSIFIFFAILVHSFHTRFRRVDDSGLRWGRHIAVLYTLSLVFVVRNLVRIIEFVQPEDGFIVTHESMLYIFDAIFMSFAMVLLLAVHPGRLLKAVRRTEKISGWGLSQEMGPLQSAKNA